MMLDVFRLSHVLILAFLLNSFAVHASFHNRNSGCGGFSSTFEITSSTEYCTSYTLEISYDQGGIAPLDQLFVAVPECGVVQDITNSNNWDVIFDVTDQYTGLEGFYISSITGFGGTNSSESFKVDFTICADGIVCQCDLQSLVTNITYEAGSCIEFEEPAVSNPGSCSLDPPPFISCEDLDVEQELFKASSSTTNGSIQHSIWMNGDPFSNGNAKFDFEDGQLIYDYNSASLYGVLTLTSGGGPLNGSQWALNSNFDATDIFDPKTELGQGLKYTETWIYYVLNDSSSYLQRIDDNTDIFTFSQRGNPFQIGLSAGGKDINEFSASSWFDWERNGQTGLGDFNINLEDLCPPNEAVSPVLECVNYIKESNSYVAHFGYENRNDKAVVIPIGNENKFTPSPEDRGQPFFFEPGRHEDQFQVEFDGNNLVWTLSSPNGTSKTSTASDNPDQRCVAVPTAVIDGDIALCNDNAGQLEIILTGSAPWTLNYSHEAETTEIEILESPYYLNVTAEGVYSLLSVEDNLGQMGTVSGLGTLTFLDKPIAVLSGDASICEGQASDLSIDLTGVAPWTVIYSDGSNQYEINANETVTIIPVDQPGTYQLVSVTDANCQGTVSGAADISILDKPTAVLSGDASICEGQASDLSIDLTGVAPWTVIYSDGSNQYEINANETVTIIPVDQPGTYQLVSVTDANCEGTASGSANISILDKPTAVLSGDASICEGQASDLSIDLTGVAPWTVIYSDGSNQYEINASETVTIIPVDQPGTYQLVSVTDANCQGTASGSANISILDKPTAVLSGGGSICEGETSELSLALTGIAPWSVIYTDGSAQYEINSDESIINFPIAQPGTYQLVSISDANCQGIVSGSAEVIGTSAKAVLSGGGIICSKGESTSISVSWTGDLPWTLVYTDGISNYKIAGINTNSRNISVNNPGIYSLVSASYNDLCQGSFEGTAEVTLVPPLIGEIIVNDSYCIGDPILLQSSIIGNLNYEWTSTGSGIFTDNGTQSTRYIPGGNDEEITFSLNVSNGCETIQLTATTKIISISGVFTIDFDQQDLMENLEYVFTAIEEEADEYVWYLNDSQVSRGRIANLIFEETGENKVQLVVTKNGCEVTTQTVFGIKSNTNLFIPNVFNPNSSNPLNNRIRVYGESISTQNFTFSIYNRWGNEVYSTSNLQDAKVNGWNGGSSNSNQENNVFTYIVRGEFSSGDAFEETGTITLVK
ncbi:MAG: gliding motility-associated C-terminal domain-containing protein [Bacteroidota bacterium]